MDTELIDHEDPPGGVGGYRPGDVRGKSSLARILPIEGAIGLPMANSRLACKHRVPWRRYPCSWDSTSPGLIGSEGCEVTLFLRDGLVRTLRSVLFRGGAGFVVFAIGMPIS